MSAGVFIRLTAALMSGVAAALALTAPAAGADVAVVGARLYPSPAAPPIADSVVLIHDGEIQAVGDRQALAVPAGYSVIQAQGKVLTAGFWNSHAHLATPDFLGQSTTSDARLSADLETMFTRWGFTTVFDLASTTATAAAVRARIEAGAVTGPNLLTVGEPFYPKDGTPIYARPIYEAAHLESAEIVSTDQAVARVTRQVREGANGIKLFTGAIIGGVDGVLIMPPDQIQAIASEAHRLDRQVFAHPTNAAGLAAAVDNGVDVLAHCAVLAGEWSPTYAADLAERRVALVPTLMLFEVFPDPQTPVSTCVQQVRALAQAGGDILFGTDAGFMEVYDTTAEFRLMSQALDWRQILTALTTAPARRFGQAAVRGRVEPGLRADLVALDADPAEDAEAFAKVAWTMKDGALIYQAKPAPAQD